MALVKMPAYRAPINADGVWIVPVSRVLRLGCLVEGCDNPACDCREVIVSAYALDERVTAFGFKNRRLVVRSVPLDDGAASPTNPTPYRIDVFTGEVRDKDDRPVDVTKDRNAAALVDALDAETLDGLARVWRRAKGLESHAGRRKTDAGPWDRGELVYWDEVFEAERLDAFRDDGGLVVALEMYCIDPDCDCHLFHVAFSEAPDDNESEGVEIGSVRVTFAGKVEVTPSRPDREARLRALWARYRRRYPTLRVQADRYREMRAFGAEYHASPQPAPAAAAAARAWVPSSKKRKIRERS